MSDVELDDALDGLQTAQAYCEARGLTDEAADLADLYQQIGQRTLTDEWTAEETHS